MNWQSLNLTLSLIGAVVGLPVWVYFARHRHIRGAVWAEILVFGAMLTCFGYGGTLGTRELSLAAWGLKIAYTGLILLPIAWAGLTFYFAGYSPWKWGFLGTLCAWQGLMLLLTWTNEGHSLIWQNLEWAQTSFGLRYLRPTYGWFFWMNISVVYGLLAGVTFLHLPFFGRNWPLYRHQYALLLGCILLPWLGYSLFVADWYPLPMLFLPALSFAAALVLSGWIVLRYDILRVMPFGYDRLLHDLSEGVLVLDVQNRIMQVNQAMRAYLDQPETPPHTFEAAFPDLLQACPDLLRQNTGECEVRHQDKDLVLRVRPIYDHPGNLRGRIILVTDISQTRQAERERAEEQAFNAALVTCTQLLNSSLNPDVVLNRILEVVGQLVPHDYANIMLLDSEGQRGRVAYSRGYPPEIMSQLHSEVWQVSDMPNFITMRQDHQPIAIPDTQRQTATWMRVENYRFVRSYIGAPILIEGKVIGFINLDSLQQQVFREVHAKRLAAFADGAALALNNARLYAQLRALDQTKSQAILMAAHNLGGPLSILMVDIEAVEAQLRALPSGQQEALTRIHWALGHLKSFSKQFLSLQKIEAQALQRTFMRQDLYPLVKKLLADCQAEAAGHQVNLEGAAGQCWVFGDRDWLYEVMNNLFSNALKYSPQGSQINLSLQAQGGLVKFSVRDQGYGIPEEKQAGLFQAFYRVSTPETEAIKGLGLGLLISKYIIEFHGGQLMFSSTYGQGSTFGFQLRASSRADLASSAD
jgi:signal transduction histidine kinase